MALNHNLQFGRGNRAPTTADGLLDGEPYYDKTHNLLYIGGTTPINACSLNGSQTATASFYAPTDAGTSGQILASNGGGAPIWVDAPASIYIDSDNYLHIGDE